MKFTSPHLLAVINGDDRHPREIAAAFGKSNPEEDPKESSILDDRMDKTLTFNPKVGGLEFTEEGAVLFCETIKEDF